MNGDADRERAARADHLAQRQMVAEHGEHRDRVAAGVDRVQQPGCRVVGERALRGEVVDDRARQLAAQPAGGVDAGLGERAVGGAGRRRRPGCRPCCRSGRRRAPSEPRIRRRRVGRRGRRTRSRRRRRRPSLPGWWLPPRRIGLSLSSKSPSLGSLVGCSPFTHRCVTRPRSGRGLCCAPRERSGLSRQRAPPWPSLPRRPRSGRPCHIHWVG